MSVTLEAYKRPHTRDQLPIFSCRNLKLNVYARGIDPASSEQYPRLVALL